MNWGPLLHACKLQIHQGANQFPLAVWQLPTQGPTVALSRRVLCVHGFLDSGRSFAHLASHLPNNWEVFAPDLRGHGKSRPLPPGAATHYWEHAKDISMLLEEFQSAQTPFDLVVGHSMGGNVTALVAASRPALAPQVVFLDMLGGLPEEPHQQVDRFGEVLAGLRHKKDFKRAASQAEAINRMQKLNPHLTAQGAALMFAANCDQDEDGSWSFAFEKDLRGKTPFRFPQEFWLALFERLKGRAWVVRGEHGYVPTAQDEPIVQTRLHALGLKDFVTFAKAGHHLHVDAVPELSEFLVQLPSIKNQQ